MPRQVLVVAEREESEALDELLTEAGYRVLRAPDLAAAHPMLARLVAPALVLLDGHADGPLATFLSTLRRVRPADFHAVPVVLLADRERQGPLGVSEVVPRPVVPSILLEVVQRLLERVG